MEWWKGACFQGVSNINAHPKGRDLSAPQFCGFLMRITLWRRTTKFDVVTHGEWACFYGVSHGPVPKAKSSTSDAFHLKARSSPSGPHFADFSLLMRYQPNSACMGIGEWMFLFSAGHAAKPLHLHKVSRGFSATAEFLVQNVVISFSTMLIDRQGRT